MKYLYEYEANCFCAGETDKSIYNPRGNSPKKLEDYRQALHQRERQQSTRTITAGTQHPREASHHCTDNPPVVPEGQSLRKTLQMTAEAASAPTTPATHKIFLQRNILVVLWLKNLNQVCYDYLSFKHKWESSCHLLQCRTTWSSGLARPEGTSSELQACVTRASEKDIVYSGLAYTVEQSAKQIMTTVARNNLGLDQRTTAYLCALKKVFTVYHEVHLLTQDLAGLPK